jgi:IMP dehydrogenase
MLLHQVAKVPPVVSSPDSTVYEAVKQMADHNVGAVLVTDPLGKVVGIFTERDNLLRVTLGSRDPRTTKLQEVMSSPVRTASPEIKVDDALNRMLRSRHRHLPVIDREQRVLGVVSVRQLLTARLDEQNDDIETLNAYVTAGGPG